MLTWSNNNLLGGGHIWDMEGMAFAILNLMDPKTRIDVMAWCANQGGTPTWYLRYGKSTYKVSYKYVNKYILPLITDSVMEELVRKMIDSSKCRLMYQYFRKVKE